MRTAYLILFDRADVNIRALAATTWTSEIIKSWETLHREWTEHLEEMMADRNARSEELPEFADEWHILDHEIWDMEEQMRAVRVDTSASIAQKHAGENEGELNDLSLQNFESLRTKIVERRAKVLELSREQKKLVKSARTQAKTARKEARKVMNEARRRLKQARKDAKVERERCKVQVRP